MAKKTYVSPGIMLLAAGDPGTGNVPFSQRDPDNPKGKAKETEFDDEEYYTGWEY